MRYKALSVRQPYAEFIRTGEKTVELRTWATDYRGPLLICSSREIAPDVDECNLRGGEKKFPLGKAICLVNLTDIRPTVEEDAYKSGEKERCALTGEVFDSDFLEDIIDDDAPHFSWVLENPRSVKADVPIRGRRYIYDVEIDESLIEL